MIRISLRRILAGAVLVPLALGLAGCGDSDASYPGLSGEPIAKIAPPQGQSWSDVVAKTPDGGYRMGNPDAPIKLVEFGALSCSHCAHFSETASAELTENFVATGRVSYELRLFILNPYDIAASLLATCGSDEAVIPLSERFWAWQPNMFQNLDKADPAQLKLAESQPPEARFATLAKITGMDEFFAARGIAMDQGAQCLANSDRATGLVNQTEKASDDYDVTGTPTFLINGRKTDVNTWPQIKAELEKLGAR